MRPESNLDKGTVLRIPITRHGTAGPMETRATGLVNIDDIAFTGAGDTLLAAINADNEVALVRPDGSHTTVLTAADGLENPTSLAVRWIEGNAGRGPRGQHGKLLRRVLTGRQPVRRRTGAPAKAG